MDFQKKITLQESSSTNSTNYLQEIFHNSIQGKKLSLLSNFGEECRSKTSKKHHTIPHYTKETHHSTTAKNVSRVVSQKGRIISW